MIMGLGTALFEEVAFADGQVTNANLSDYEMPSFADLPGADARAARAGRAPRCTGSARRRCRRCRPRSATRSARSGST